LAVARLGRVLGAGTGFEALAFEADLVAAFEAGLAGACIMSVEALKKWSIAHLFAVGFR
jgi:hypothetical protein